MNDPHVSALHYRIKYADSVDFDNAPPLKEEQPAFLVYIEKGEAVVTMKEHYATVDEARAIVEPFLKAWELSAALFSANDDFEFAFRHGDVIDRRPAPGVVQLQGIAVGISSAVSLHARVGRGSYPSPPAGIARDAYVDLMLDRYRMYCGNRTTLSDAANYCLTALQLAGGGDRKQTAKYFGIALQILSTLGMLAANKGGREARKAKGSGVDYDPQERKWLQEVLKMIIRRAAELAYDPSAAHKQITMADLPPLP